MPLVLTWDLFVVVFFAVVIGYSFIIGKHESVKIIISTYIALVAGQGLGSFLSTNASYPQALLQTFGFTINITILGTSKLIIFIATIIFLASRGGFEIQYGKERGSLINLAITGLFGFATAALLLSTLLTFIADTTLLDPAIAANPTLYPVVEQSPLMKVLLLYQGIWYALPALLIILVGSTSYNAD